MDLAPVVLFVYNRLEKVRNCLGALERNAECSQTDLYIYADGAKGKEEADRVAKVREFIKEIYIPQSKFKQVNLIESAYNKGLANSIIGGVTQVIKRYRKVIVVEDDLLVSDDFLAYMNGALIYYEGMPNIGSVSAYTYPLKELNRYKKDVFMLRKGECWGWGTWEDRWTPVDWNVQSFEEYRVDEKMRREFDSIGCGLDSMLCSYVEGTLDTWAVRWCYHLYRNNLLTVYPRISRTKNEGCDGSGVHCVATDRFAHENIGSDLRCNFEMLEVDHKLEKAVCKYDAGKASLLDRIIGRLIKFKAYFYYKT